MRGSMYNCGCDEKPFVTVRIALSDAVESEHF